MNIKKTLLHFFLLMFMALSVCAHANSLDDSAITTKIKAAILLDPNLSVFHVDVKTHNKIVVLTGTVDTDVQASKLIEIAQSTNGVRDVRADKLIVRQSVQPFADLLITSKIKGLYIREKLFGDGDISAFTIKINTNNGIVSLTGTASNAQQIQRAVEIANSVKGVESVQSYVSVVIKDRG